ncbi:hypothetical protein TWF696_005482 [Orbilia brochopaga]|uniref:DUF1770-domain-containing protein n=1 Tax=Orbilia brochopaga TaxID=3140254 RepID=A0AAV9V1P5_9PEZI
MSDVPFLAAQSALTDAHIRHNPTPESSIAPSTAADSKTILTPSHDSYSSHSEDLEDDLDDDDVASITSSILYQSHHTLDRAIHRPLPPLPDLRFEQSYLASIKNASAQGKYWLVALITVRDQLVFPLVQGCLWNLGLLGWRYWNRGVKFRGGGVGARVRRWWWQVNGWEYPSRTSRSR